MSAKLRTRLLIAGAVAAALFGAFACQNYNFDPVVPSTVVAHTNRVPMQSRREKPYIMLAVDSSGSMTEATDAQGASCSENNQYIRGGNQRCKWNDLRSAFADPTTGFLASAKDLAYFGLAHFPASSGESCSTGEIVEHIDSQNSNADAVRLQIYDTLSPHGGTPTAATLQAVLAQESLLQQDTGTTRDRFVMLLTDGLPNCNESDEMQARCDACNADSSTCVTPTGCRPTDGNVDKCTGTTNCLDDDATVAAVTALRAAGVQTFVIGFGKGTATGDAVQVLNAAADAGGRARSDPTTRYYQAANRDELRQALADISASVQICKYALDPKPASESALQIVYREGTDVEDPPSALPDCPQLKDGFCALVKERHWRFTDTTLSTVEILDAGAGAGPSENFCARTQNPVANTSLSFYSVAKL